MVTSEFGNRSPLRPRFSSSVAEELAGGREHLGGRVVGGGEPAVREPGNAAQAGLRAPAADPQRDAAVTPRRRCERRLGDRVEAGLPLRGGLAPEQGPQDAHGLLEPRPAFVERHPDRFVVELRRARADAGDHAAVREDVECRDCLRQRRRAAQRSE